MKPTKPKPPKGHKRKSISYGVSVTCECGWQSSTWYGPGASTQAHNELRSHQEKEAGKDPA